MSVATRPQRTPATTTAEEVRESLAPLYVVVCHDDPYTTMDFVVEVFTAVFRLPHGVAVTRMLEVHNAGSADVGRYPKETAERKVKSATARARGRGFPLTFSVERDG